MCCTRHSSAPAAARSRTSLSRCAPARCRRLTRSWVGAAEPCGSTPRRPRLCGWPVRFAVILSTASQPAARAGNGEFRRAERGAEVRGGEPPAPAAPARCTTPAQRAVPYDRVDEVRYVIEFTPMYRGGYHVNVSVRAGGAFLRRSSAICRGRSRQVDAQPVANASRGTTARATAVQLPGGVCATLAGTRRLRRRRADEALVPVTAAAMPRRRRDADHRPPGVRVPMRADRGATARSGGASAAPQFLAAGPRVPTSARAARATPHAARARVSRRSATTARSAASTRWSKSASTLVSAGGLCR